MKVTFELDMMRDGPAAILEKLKSSDMRRLIEDLGKEMKRFLDYGDDSLTYPYLNKHKPIKNAKQMASYILGFINIGAEEEDMRTLFTY